MAGKDRFRQPGVAFTAERKRVLDAARDGSRRFDRAPVLVDSVTTFAVREKLRAIDGDRVWLVDESNRRTLLPDSSHQRLAVLGSGQRGRAADAFHTPEAVRARAPYVRVIDTDSDRALLRHIDCAATIQGTVGSPPRSIQLEPDLVASPEPRLPGWVVTSPDRLAMPRQASLCQGILELPQVLLVAAL